MSDAKILDFTAKREKNVEQKRRQFERVLFQNFLGCYSVIDDKGSLYNVELVDVSHDGCLFQVPMNAATKVHPFTKGKDITLRIYFTNESFLPAVVNIKYSQDMVDAQGNPMVQCGCQFDKSVGSFKALESFINFIYSFSEHSQVDNKSQRVFFL